MRTATIVLCPTTEADLGDGAFTTFGFLDVHGAFAIGSDSHIQLSPVRSCDGSNINRGLQGASRMFWSLSKGSRWGAGLWHDRCAAGAKASARRIGSLQTGYVQTSGC